MCTYFYCVMRYVFYKECSSNLHIAFWKAVSGECEEQSRSYDMVRGPLREVTEYSLMYIDEYTLRL